MSEESAAGINQFLIPIELRRRAQWVNWRSETRNGRPDKPPYIAGPRQAGHASSTDAATWRLFDPAYSAVKLWADGVGFVPCADDDLVFIDLDGCIVDGEISTAALAIVEAFNTYTEVSPSGNGLRIVMHAKLKSERHKASDVPWAGRHDKAELEVADRNKYFTITSRHVSSTPREIEHRQDELDAFVTDFLPAKPAPKPDLHVVSDEGLADDEILAIVREASNADKFRELWAGGVNGYASISEATAGLLWILAFYTRDPDQLDRLFRRSGLMRAKFDERRGSSTWGRQEIEGALEHVTEQYHSSRPRSIDDDQQDDDQQDDADDHRHEQQHEHNGGRRRGARFSAAKLSADDFRNTRWALQGYVPLGSVAAQLGIGGAGKGVFGSYLLAKATRGQLPGHLEGHPVNVLIIGNEDDYNERWGPAIVAAGGDIERVYYLRYDDGVPFDTVEHIKRLEELIIEHEIWLFYLDQILDNFSQASNSNTQKDVRLGLAPLTNLTKRVARPLPGEPDIMVGPAGLYSMHPRKGMSQGPIRELGGASGQFTDVPRSAYIVGYHPREEYSGWRVVARGKANVGATPPAIVFRIGVKHVENPKTGERVEVPVPVDMVQDEDLSYREVSLHEPRHTEPRERVRDKIERIARAIGADGEWHSRTELRFRCEEEEAVAESTFGNSYPLACFEVKREGKESYWKLKETSK
jgi:putative DNA primase/helicase